MGGSAELIGTTGAVWRYPVKSMQGESLTAAVMGQRGLVGDRAYGLLDRLENKIASAKNPRKWPDLLGFSAAYCMPPHDGLSAPVRITLPDGRTVISGAKGVDGLLSAVLGRDVTLKAEAPERARFEMYTPIMAGVSAEEWVDEVEMPPGTFFDGALVHVLTTASLERLGELYPEGCFEAQRFRPNVVIATRHGTLGFIENTWIGRDIAIGGDVRLRINAPCGRCVMTTLAQGNLPHDPGILRTVARHNRAAVGVYAEVIGCGTVACGDPVWLE
jgi:uncharacterized protein